MEAPETPATPSPWDRLAELLDAGGTEEVRAYWDKLPLTDLAITLSRLSEERRAALLALLPAEVAADMLGDLSDVQAAAIVQDLEPAHAAEIVSELPSDDQADLLADLPDAHAEAILAEMDPVEAQEARRLSQYADDTAGGLMVTEYVAFPWHHTVAQVVDALREHAEEFRDFQVQYAYVTTTDGLLRGVLPLRDLLLAPRSRPIGELMIENPLSLPVTASLLELKQFFDEHAFVGVPVVDGRQRLLGVVHHRSVDAAWNEEAEAAYRRSQGIVHEELRTMPLVLRARRRLSWLSINIVLNIVAASVIALYQDTLAQVIALAVFLPIISDMSGCSGNQAVAVSMRELTLGLLRPRELLRVWGKEASVGVVNGIALGLLIALVAWAWKGNPWLGLVVGAAMALNTLVAVVLGGSIPLVLKLARKDPALASGPILTTVTDMFGFFLVLGMATLMLPLLLG